MRIVLDSSAGIRLAIGEAPASVQEAAKEAIWVGAVGLYDYEVTNVVWKYLHLGHWTSEEADIVLEHALALPDERQDGVELAREALSLAKQCKRAAYDMFYVVLARRNDAYLATADKALCALAPKLGVRTV